MLASKENARKALRLFNTAYRDNVSEYSFVREFIESAIKRLPREESFKRDRERCRAKVANN